MVLGWCTDLFAFLFYIVRHNYYYHLVSRYFSISQELRRSLSEVRIPLSWLTVMMNLGTLTVVYCALMFTVSYAYPGSKWKRLLAPLALPVILQFLIYHPSVSSILYLRMAETGIAFSSIEKIKIVTHAATRVINSLYLFAAVMIMIRHILQCKLRVIRLINSCVSISFVCFIAIFYLVFGSLPRFWLNITTVTDYVTYIPLNVASNPALMQYFPYICLLGILVIAVVFYRYCSIEKTFHKRQLKVSAHLNQFSAGFNVVSHSLKNQILCIEEEAKQIEENIGSNEAVLEAAGEIQKYACSMFDSITRLNSNLKIQHIELSLISLTDLCREIMEEVSRSAAHYTLQIAIPDTDIFCFASNSQLKECILNLIHNARDAIDDQRGLIRFTLEEEKNWAIISIIDNGCGISKLEQERIFQPFYSTKSSVSNWGIGLSTCDKIIEVHGGKLLVNSEPGSGTTFQILLSTIY